MTKTENRLIEGKNEENSNENKSPIVVICLGFLCILIGIYILWFSTMIASYLQMDFILGHGWGILFLVIGGVCFIGYAISVSK